MAYLLLAILVSGLVWNQVIRNLIQTRFKYIAFDNSYIEVKQFYVKNFRSAPSICFINNVDTAKVFQYISDGHAGRIFKIYQNSFHSWQRDRTEFNETLFLIEGRVMIELGEEYVQILFPSGNHSYADKLLSIFKSYKSEGKEEDHEINIITAGHSGLELKPLAINKTDLDISAYYNDDFAEVHEQILLRLRKENDKGIVLLHGLPGTGKTTYLRHLIGSLKKKILFVSPAVAGNLMNPDFIELLIDNPNAVLVIEDAENIIMDRKYSSNASVSNLLNLSDGLLSDCLNVQVICTFNSELSMVDSALLRKGRLIARYEFCKLALPKAKRLAERLGIKQEINQAMTLAEITNANEKDFKIEKTEVLGFRRKEIQLN